MNDDRTEGSMKEMTGDIEDDAGKLRSEDKADKVEGKVQNAVGGIKDALAGNDKSER